MTNPTNLSRLRDEMADAYVAELSRLIHSRVEGDHFKAGWDARDKLTAKRAYVTDEEGAKPISVSHNPDKTSDIVLDNGQSAPAPFEFDSKLVNLKAFEYQKMADVNVQALAGRDATAVEALSAEDAFYDGAEWMFKQLAERVRVAEAELAKQKEFRLAIMQTMNDTDAENARLIEIIKRYASYMKTANYHQMADEMLTALGAGGEE